MAYYLCVYNGHRQLPWLEILADYDFLHTLQFIFLYLNTADNNFERTLWLEYSWSHLNRDSALIQRGQLWSQEMIWSSCYPSNGMVTDYITTMIWSFFVIHENVTVISWYDDRLHLNDNTIQYQACPVQSEWL